MMWSPKATKPEAKTRSPRSFLFLTILLGAAAQGAWALHWPDTTELKDSLKVLGRSQGKPATFAGVWQQDSLYLHLEWQDSNLVQIRYTREIPFEVSAFSALANRMGRGGTWHELPDPEASLRDSFPGIEQHWVLRGYGGRTGWVGSGLHRGRFFLAFRKKLPVSLPGENAALALHPRAAFRLDSATDWLRNPCDEPQDTRLCFSHSLTRGFDLVMDTSGRRRLEIRYPSHDSLGEVRAAFFTIPGSDQAGYAEDLTQIMYMEGLQFLVLLDQQVPPLFTWASWQWERADGRVDPSKILDLMKKKPYEVNEIPIFHHETENLDVRIYLNFDGQYRLELKEKKKT